MLRRVALLIYTYAQTCHQQLTPRPRLPHRATPLPSGLRRSLQLDRSLVNTRVMLTPSCSLTCRGGGACCAGWESSAKAMRKRCNSPLLAANPKHRTRLRQLSSRRDPAASDKRGLRRRVTPDRRCHELTVCEGACLHKLVAVEIGVKRLGGKRRWEEMGWRGGEGRGGEGW